MSFLKKIWRRKNGFTKEPRLALWNANEEIHRFEDYAKLLTCPGCQQKNGFKLTDYERGKDGWELHLVCQKCRVSAVLNNTGFRVTGLTVEKTK